MGLTIHYSISLPRNTKLENVKAKVEALRQRCLDLPFKVVDDVVFLAAKNGDNMEWRDLKDDKDDEERDSKWNLLFTTATEACYNPVPGKQFVFGQIHEIKRNKKGSIGINVPPEIAIGFSAWPGEGCEGSDISIGLAPAEIKAPVYRGAEKYLPMKIGGAWQGRSFCKTQYANNPACGGLTNFLRCHLCVIAMLDAAKEIGFKVDVYDEGAYWQNRDIPALVKEIGDWDKFIAAVSGILKDIKGASVISAMDGRQDFEALEREGIKLYGEKFSKLMPKSV